jgi:hypothetical protein
VHLEAGRRFRAVWLSSSLIRAAGGRPAQPVIATTEDAAGFTGTAQPSPIRQANPS